MAKPSLFGRKIEKVSTFVNAACLYLRMKIMGESKSTKMA